MAIVCSSCDHEPSAGATAGAPCASCGERLLLIETKDELVGTVIDGRFEVLAPLGHGGMGVVYRAKQLSIGREVALKVLDRRIEKDVASVKRFFREAKVASALAHPHTVPIIDFGQSAEGRLFLVMELVRGETLLEDITRDGPMSIARVITIGTQLCEALEVAHGLAIVHRDLKLENVMLLDRGQIGAARDHIKILDFGLARTLTDPSTQATATGLISGTPRYMPPEVALAAVAPEPSQDMYAVGVMLAELVIGRALWVAPTLEALFTKKLATEQSIADVPEALRPLIRALLSADPKQRPTAGTVRQQLRDLDPSRTSLKLDLEHTTELDSADFVPVVLVEPAKKLARARSPVALEPTAEVAPLAPAPDPFANLTLVAIDELDGPVDRAPKPAVDAAPPMRVEARQPAPLLGDPFAAPEQEARGLELEIDRGYLAQRSQKQRAIVPDPIAVKPRRSSAGRWFIGLLLVAALGGGGYFFYRYRVAADGDVAGPGVSIRIIGDGAQVTIDGKRAGKSPLSLKLPKGDKPVLIEAEGYTPQKVVPDRDQTIELAKP